MSDPGVPASSRLRRWQRRAVWLTVGLLAVLAPLCGRVAWEGRAEQQEAARAAAEGRGDDEIVHLGRAARWRLPLFSHDQDAIARLMQLGAEHEARGPEGRDMALAAYREARGAIVATRALGLPDEDAFDAANARIAVLMAEQERELGMDLSGEGRQEAYHRALLDVVPGPDPLWAALVALSFLAWVAATAGLTLRALDAQGRLRPRPALRWGAASLLLLVAWMVLLRLL
jgi:hypothetical protein